MGGPRGGRSAAARWRAVGTGARAARRARRRVPDGGRRHAVRPGHDVQLSARDSARRARAGGYPARRGLPAAAARRRRSSGALDALERGAADGEQRLFRALEQVGPRIVDADALRSVDPDLRSLFNVNTPRTWPRPSGSLPGTIRNREPPVAALGPWRSSCSARAPAVAAPQMPAAAPPTPVLGAARSRARQRSSSRAPRRRLPAHGPRCQRAGGSARRPQRIHTLSVGYDEITFRLVEPARIVAIGTSTANPDFSNVARRQRQSAPASAVTPSRSWRLGLIWSSAVPSRTRPAQTAARRGRPAGRCGPGFVGGCAGGKHSTAGVSVRRGGARRADDP